MSNPVRSSISTIIILMVFFEFAIVNPVCAYIDPGTGSYLFSVMVALVCGIGYAVKTYWGQLRQCIGRLRRKKQDK